MRKGRGRLKITLVEIIKNDILIKKVTQNMISDRI